jgi:hypothetical protein
MPRMGLIVAAVAAANPSPPTTDSTWIAVAVGGLFIIYFLLRPRKKKGASSEGVPSFPLARQRGVEEQMSNLLVELAEMARQISGQLDTRAAKLELLIKEADAKIEALRSAANAKAFPPSSVPTIDGQSTSDDEVSDASDTPPPPIEAPAAASAPTADPRYAEVYDLADEGRSAFEIARILNRPTGEIELILALRPR